MQIHIFITHNKVNNEQQQQQHTGKYNALQIIAGRRRV